MSSTRLVSEFKVNLVRHWVGDSPVVMVPGSAAQSKRSPVSFENVQVKAVPIESMIDEWGQRAEATQGLEPPVAPKAEATSEQKPPVAPGAERRSS